jgi:hypothetical protein
MSEHAMLEREKTETYYLVSAIAANLVSTRLLVLHLRSSYALGIISVLVAIILGVTGIISGWYIILFIDLLWCLVSLGKFGIDLASIYSAQRDLRKMLIALGRDISELSGGIEEGVVGAEKDPNLRRTIRIIQTLLESIEEIGRGKQ